MAERFTVLSQEQVVARLPDNNYGPVVRITFRTAAGTVGAVEVPVTVYNVDTARAAIEERVAHLDAVQDL